MAGQTWGTSADGGYLYSDELSDKLRKALQPLLSFRQHCDAKDAMQQKQPKHGDKFYWDIISNVSASGGQLTETTAMPETKFTISQGVLTIYEWGNSVPYSGVLNEFSKFDVEKIIDDVLADDCAKVLDDAAYDQFNATQTVFNAASGTSTTLITLDTNGTPSVTNNVELGTGHIKAIVDTMKERNVPAYEGRFYRSIAHPTTFRTMKNSLETLHSYTDKGFDMILNGEIGRYENVRFFEQTNIPKETASPAWTNAKSNWMFIFGRDTVMEGIVIEEEMRGKIPTDFGRSRGVAWYALLGFGLVHSVAAQSRIFKWASAA